MRRSSFVNWSLFLASLILSLVIGELFLRFLLFNSNSSIIRLAKNPAYYTVYPKSPNTDFFNEDYWKLNYLFHKKFNVESPHPLLGWTGFFNRHDLLHNDIDNIGTKRPVLFYGDSFAQCIDSVDCFEDYINSDPDINNSYRFLNYGVSSYGLDQIYLLFRETAHKYNEPIIIFSMLTNDLDRSLLKVRDAQKPYFEIENGELQLKGTPITMSSEDYFIQNPPNINSYLWNRLYNLMRPKQINHENHNSYLEKSKELNGMILKKLFEDLKSLNTEFIFLIFQPAWHSENDWRLQFLKTTCEENNVPYFCDVEIRNSAMENYGYSMGNLFILNDGHPSSLANKLVSDEIKKYILDPALFHTRRKK